MSDRIDDYFAGALRRDALTASEQADADTVACAADEIRTFLERRSPPDIAGRVMHRIQPPELHCIQSSERPAAPVTHSWLGRLAIALWAPRQISLRPVYVVGAVATCLVLVWFLPHEWRSSGSPTAAAPDAARVFVQFRLEMPDAARVQLAGTFTNWQPRYELHEGAPGVWTITVPLAAGVHDYAFLIDGMRWVTDPHGAHISDGFGGTNSRLSLLVGDEPRL